MGLLGNHSVLNKNPGRAFGGSTVSETRAAWGKAGARRGMFMGEASWSQLASIPNGCEPPYSLVLPIRGGDLVARLSGSGTVTASAASGINLTVPVDGSATIAAALGVVTSLAASILGASTIAASLTGSIALTSAITGASTIAANAGLKTSMSTAISGSSTVAASMNGVLSMTCAIASYTDLSSEGLAAAVWAAAAAQNNTSGSMGEKVNDAGSAANPWTEVIESGLTAAQAMRLIVAALAGEVSGAEGTTVTIRSAVADDADRIVATVDADGNRTAITYDLD